VLDGHPFLVGVHAYVICVRVGVWEEQQQERSGRAQGARGTLQGAGRLTGGVRGGIRAPTNLMCMQRWEQTRDIDGAQPPGCAPSPFPSISLPPMVMLMTYSPGCVAACATT
jgi:hypothetical protein